MAKKEPIYMEEIAEQALRLVKWNLDNLETVMTRDKIGEFNVARANSANALAKGLAVLLKEVRAINKVNAESVTNLGPTEKRKLLVGWFEKQPMEVQKSLLFEMTALINKGRLNAS